MVGCCEITVCRIAQAVLAKQGTTYVGTGRLTAVVAAAAGLAPPDGRAPLTAQRATVVAGPARQTSARRMPS